MARLTRLTLANHLHYVVQRGHGREAVFVDDGDRQAYLDALRQAAKAHGVAIHAFVLLDDCVQWLATPVDGAALSRTVQAIGQRFVGAFNRRHGLRGTRWEGRFRSAVVEASAYGVALGVMMEQEPVVLGKVAEPADWRWSSARHHLGRERLPWIVDAPVLWQLGNTPFEREAAYAAALRSNPYDSIKKVITHASNRGWALGGAQFLEEVGKIAQRPAVPQARGRPKSSIKSVPIKNETSKPGRKMLL